MPKISVIIPLYNKEKYILRSIQSVLVQDYLDYEIVVVDDGSTDDSLEIIKANVNSPKVKIFSQKNGGPAFARNTGVQKAKGEWIVFLDADDEFLPNALTIFDKLIQEHSDISYIICNYYLQQSNCRWMFTNIKTDTVLEYPFLFEYLEVLSGRPGSEIIKRDTMLKIPYNESLRRYEDAENQYRILNNYKVYQCSTPVMISNRDASEAAGFRKNFSEDFLSCMIFKGKSFWEQMQLYKLSLEAWYGYRKCASTLYRDVYEHKIYKLVHRFYRKWKMLSDSHKQLIVNLVRFI